MHPDPMSTSGEREFEIDQGRILRLVWLPLVVGGLFAALAFLPVTVRRRWGDEIPEPLSSMVFAALAALALFHAWRIFRLARSGSDRHVLAILRLRLRRLDLLDDPEAWSRVEDVYVRGSRPAAPSRDRSDRIAAWIIDRYYVALGLTPTVHVIYDERLEAIIPRVYAASPDTLSLWIKDRMV